MNWLLAGLFIFYVGCRDSSTIQEPVLESNNVAIGEAVNCERCEIPEQKHQKNHYTNQGSYGIALCDGVIEVTLRLNLIGDDELLDKFRQAIEQTWSTDRFDVEIQVYVIWTAIDPDKTIHLNEGFGRFNTSEWYTHGLLEEASAHEAGHYLGLFDEYGGGGDAQGFNGGASPGPRPWHSPGIMTNCNFPTLDYYYDHFLDWYEGLND